jgi:hypothetical protein
MYYVAYYALWWTGEHMTAATYPALAAPYVTAGYALLVCLFYRLLRHYIRQVAAEQ